MDDAPNEPKVFRLTDIDTHEVSIVDQAANQRKFLVVKNQGVDMKKGAAVVSDGKGGHTVAKEETPAPASTPGSTAPGAPQSEPVIALSPEAKAELMKRFAAAAERLATLKSMVEAATETVGLVEVPAEIAMKVAELLTGIAQGEVEKGKVEKGLPQFSTARTAQLQAAYEALGAVLGGVSKPPVTETVSAPSEETAAPDADVAKAVSAYVKPLEEKLAKALEKIATLVAQHGEAISKQSARVEAVEKSGRATPRSGVAEGALARVEKGEDDDVVEPGGWPSDMANPDKYDVGKTDPSVRFTVPKH